MLPRQPHGEVDAAGAWRRDELVGDRRDRPARASSRVLVARATASTRDARLPPRQRLRDPVLDQPVRSRACWARTGSARSPAPNVGQQQPLAAARSCRMIADRLADVLLALRPRDPAVGADARRERDAAAEERPRVRRSSSPSARSGSRCVKNGSHQKTMFSSDHEDHQQDQRADRDDRDRERADHPEVEGAGRRPNLPVVDVLERHRPTAVHLPAQLVRERERDVLARACAGREARCRSASGCASGRTGRVEVEEARRSRTARDGALSAQALVRRAARALVDAAGDVARRSSLGERVGGRHRRRRGRRRRGEPRDTAVVLRRRGCGAVERRSAPSDRVQRRVAAA